jgi:hypothetical protein
MRTFLIPSLAAAGAVAAVMTLPAPGPAPADDAARFGWHTDYAAGRAEARRTGKPMLVTFRCVP